MTRPGAVAWMGTGVLWLGAAVMSFAGLDGLARSCYIAPVIAWLLPLVVDVGVAVAAWVWRRGVNPAAARLAGRLTWSLLVLTVLGNGAHLGMEASRILPPWWVAALVGAIPPAVAGATAHLLVLLGRTDAAGEGAPSTPPASAAPTEPDTIEPATTPTHMAGGNVRGAVQTRPVGPDPAALIAAGAGRRKLAAELGVTEHEARQLIERHRTNGHPALEDAR